MTTPTILLADGFEEAPFTANNISHRYRYSYGQMPRFVTAGLLQEDATEQADDTATVEHLTANGRGWFECTNDAEETDADLGCWVGYEFGASYDDLGVHVALVAHVEAPTEILSWRWGVASHADGTGTARHASLWLDTDGSLILKDHAGTVLGTSDPGLIPIIDPYDAFSDARTFLSMAVRFVCAADGGGSLTVYLAGSDTPAWSLTGLTTQDPDAGDTVTSVALGVPGPASDFFQLAFDNFIVTTGDRVLAAPIIETYLVASDGTYRQQTPHGTAYGDGATDSDLWAHVLDDWFWGFGIDDIGSYLAGSALARKASFFLEALKPQSGYTLRYVGIDLEARANPSVDPGVTADASMFLRLPDGTELASPTFHPDGSSPIDVGGIDVAGVGSEGWRMFQAFWEAAAIGVTEAGFPGASGVQVAIDASGSREVQTSAVFGMMIYELGSGGEPGSGGLAVERNLIWRPVLGLHVMANLAWRPVSALWQYRDGSWRPVPLAG